MKMPWNNKPWTAPTQRPTLGKPTPPAGQPPQQLMIGNPAVRLGAAANWAQKRAAQHMSAGGPTNKVTANNLPAVGKDSPVLTVTSQCKRQEIGIETLLGDYAEKGTNHGQKYYQKVQKIPGHEDINVYLYYWDMRDGTDYCGWWFGDEIGGSQVWARCNSHDRIPPRAGWKIPWDAPSPEPGILFVDAFTGGSSSSGATMPSTSTSMAPMARLRKATAQVDAAEKTAKEVLSKTKPLLPGVATEETLKEAQEQLLAQQGALMEVQKSLTMDISEARKGGISATGAVTELSKQSPRLRTVQASIATELNRIKGQLVRAIKEAVQGRQSAETQKKQKEQEEKDSKELEESMPEARDIVTTAEDAVESVGIMASPLIAEPPEDVGETLNKALGEIEGAAADAQNRINEARSQINNKLASARKYAPETRKTALSEYSGLQAKLTEAQKKLTPYKTFRKEFHARVTAKKALTDISEKLNEMELEVEKASMMSAAAEQGQMSEDEVNSIQELVGPAQKGIADATKQLEQKLRVAAVGAMKDELTSMLERVKASKTKLEDVSKVLSRQREGLATQQMLVQASDKVDKVEEALLKCQEAEMPFLKGLEVLPPDESGKAIGESETAAAQADAKTNQAKGYIKSKLAEAKRYSAEVAKRVTDELGAQSNRLEGIMKKIAAFKKETSDRKMASMLAEAIDTVTQAEKKVAALGEAAAVFSSDGLEKVTVDVLKEAGDKSKVAEKDASAACSQARKILTIKQKENKGKDAVEALGKLNVRLNTTQQDLAKHRKAASICEKLIKSKEILVQEEEKLATVEEEMGKAETIQKENEKMSDETVEQMDSMLTSNQKLLKASQRSIEALLPGAVPEVKVLLNKLVERCKGAVTRIETLQAATKDQRERVLSEAFVREGTKKAEDVEAAMEKVNDAELPFLKGIEVLPLKEATETISESEVAAAAVQAAVNNARTFIASKNLEIRHFAEAVSKPTAEQLGELTKRINVCTQKLAQFRKDTEGRKKTAQVQQVGEKVAALEEQVKKTAEAAEPLANEDKEKLSEAALEACQQLLTLEKGAQALVDEVKSSLTTIHKEIRSSASHTEALQKLQARVAEATAQLAKAKKVSREHQNKFTAKRIVQEASDKLQTLQDALENSRETCSPLLEHGGEKFLVAASAQILATALRDHMKDTAIDVEALFEKVKGGSTTLTQETFISYIKKLPEELGREEITFTPERRQAIFAHLDDDKDSALSPAEFKSLFQRRYACISSISVTDVFEIGKSKTVGKAEKGEFLDALGNAQTDESNGMTRIECKMADGKIGWITMKGNQGTVYLEEHSPFTVFSADIAAVIDEAAKTCAKTQSFLEAKMAEARSPGNTGPLAEAKAELQKIQPKVTNLQSELDSLRKKVAVAKKEYEKKEKAEANAHIEAREKKAADALLEVTKSKIEALEACVKNMEELTKPFSGVQASALDELATPATTLAEAEQLLKELLAAAEVSKACIKEQQEKVGKPNSGPMIEAKQQLIKMNKKADESAIAGKRSVAAAKSTCSKLVDSKLSKASEAIRSQVQTQSISYDQLFEKLAAGEERIPEDAFRKYLASLEGFSCSDEQAQLICRRIEEGGIGRRGLMRWMQQYFKVVKSIAITTEFEIAKAKTIKKAEVDEIIELLEGPRMDEKLGLTRIRGKSLATNATGWISVKGNQGTPFLKEVEKPHYVCTAEVAMETEFKDGQLVRTLKGEEVIELLEGPRQESLPCATRVKVRAISDKVTGWSTVKDKKGSVFTEANDKVYKCVAGVAMTDALDIKNCKVVKKLAIDELMVMLEGPIDEEAASITRMKAKSIADGKEGWVTIKGNAGTVYAEKSAKHYSVLQEVPLQKTFATEGGELIRTLNQDEVLFLLDGPKEESVEPEVQVKGRAVSDGSTGWVSLNRNKLAQWSPLYKCLKATEIYQSRKTEDAEVVRKLNVSETVELLEGPMEDGEAGSMRMRGRAKKDGASGWLTIKDSEGTKFLESKG